LADASLCRQPALAAVQLGTQLLTSPQDSDFQVNAKTLFQDLLSAPRIIHPLSNLLFISV